jgi:hypothetical protein
MSHTTRRKSALKNADLIKAAVEQMPGAKFLGQQTVKQFGSAINGVAVQLPGFKYPIAINTQTGEISSDTFNGHWGKPELIDKLAQNYGIEVAKAEAEQLRGKFDMVTLDDGSVECTITLGGMSDVVGGGTGALPGSSAPTL